MLAATGSPLSRQAFTVLLIVGFELTMWSAGLLLHEGQAGDKQVMEVKEAEKQDLYTLTQALPGITGDQANGLLLEAVLS